MLDCWMAFDVEYTVRLAETLRPYRLKWMEECLIPEDIDGTPRAAPAAALADAGDRRALVHARSVPVGRRAPRRGYSAAGHQLVRGRDGLPQIADAADAAGISVILHAGGNTAFGQHFSFATPCVPWCEFFVGTDPGVPLEQGWR